MSIGSKLKFGFASFFAGLYIFALVIALIFLVFSNIFMALLLLASILLLTFLQVFLGALIWRVSDWAFRKLSIPIIKLIKRIEVGEECIVVRVDRSQSIDDIARDDEKVLELAYLPIMILITVLAFLVEFYQPSNLDVFTPVILFVALGGFALSGIIAIPAYTFMFCRYRIQDLSNFETRRFGSSLITASNSIADFSALIKLITLTARFHSIEMLMYVLVPVMYATIPTILIIKKYLGKRFKETLSLFEENVEEVLKDSIQTKK